jgi:hypothetical protein
MRLILFLLLIAPVWEFISAGKRMLTSAGLRKTRAGKRRLASGTNDYCCCCSGCLDCSDSAPCNYILSFSGVTACNTACTACVGINLSTMSGFGGASTYTLPREEGYFGGGCRWRLDISGPGFWDGFWTNTTCTGPPPRFSNSLIFVTKKTNGGIKQIRVEAYFNASAYWFDSGWVNQDTCNDGAGYTFSNASACSGCVGAATGGSVTVTPA